MFKSWMLNLLSLLDWHIFENGMYVSISESNISCGGDYGLNMLSLLHNCCKRPLRLLIAVSSLPLYWLSKYSVPVGVNSMINGPISFVICIFKSYSIFFMLKLLFNVCFPLVVYSFLSMNLFFTNINITIIFCNLEYLFVTVI